MGDQVLVVTLVFLKIDDPKGDLLKAKRGGGVDLHF